MEPEKIYPTSFQTVDVILSHPTLPIVILGKKKGENGWRFPGGFVDPTDQSLEDAAMREAKEEVGGDVMIGQPKYIGSFRIDDPRYLNSQDKIMTALFLCVCWSNGELFAKDDLEKVRWQEEDGLMDCLIDIHKPLGQAFLDHTSF